MNNDISGYFNLCDQKIKRELGYMYTLFMRSWIYQAIEDHSNADQYVIWFEQESLSKVDVVKDRKIVKTFNRDEFVNPKIDLDSTTQEQNPYAKEFLENEEKFMKFIRFSDYIIPISGSTFIIPISATPNANQ